MNKNNDERISDLNSIIDINNSPISISEIFNNLCQCQKLFKESFEKSDYKMLRNISDICEILLNKISIENCGDNQKLLLIFLEVASFIFEQTYKFPLEVNVLKQLIDYDYTSKDIKIKALEKILLPDPEIKYYIDEDYDKYVNLLEHLRQ